jgi:hypothetical protein
MEVFVCSVCRSPCGQDSRMGSLDVYLTCECARDPIWINDGRGGYSVNRNGAEPVRFSELAKRRDR